MTDRRPPTLNIQVEDHSITGSFYQVVKEFHPRLEDELGLKLGDTIEVISDDKEFNDGWYMGKSLSTGSVGLYPKSFTQLVPSLSRPTLLRARSRRIASPTSTTQSPVQATPPVTKLRDETAAVIDDADDNHQLTTALSDIDKALEELKNDVKAKEDSFTESSGSLNPETVESWSPEQVTTYFKYLGFDSQSADQFLKHKITGSILLELELAYLKELDISSFGTRFEIYKEIEALKELSSTQKQNFNSAANNNSNGSFKKEDDTFKSQPSTPFASKSSELPNNITKNIDDDLETFTRPLGHIRRKSKSLDDIPESSRHSAHPKKDSLGAPPPISRLPQIPHEQFVSPRRAPNPPSYRSPIQVRENYTSNQNTPTANTKRISNHAHSRNPSYDINPSFHLKTSHSRKSSYDPGHSRSASQHTKSVSTADLLNDNGRPVSSIYLDFNNHSRHSSINLRGSNHTRRVSDLSVKNEKQEKAHRRHSSVFSFLSASNNLNSGTGNVSPSRQSLGRPISFFGGSKKKDSPARNSTISIGNNDLDYGFDYNYGDSPTLDPKALNKRRSVSAKNAERDPETIPQLSSSMLPPPSPTKRSVSEAVRNKTLRNISTSNLKKSKTSAFMEGIRNITPAESINTADCFGWVNKRGGIAVGTWKQRYFTLHGTRLSYFTSLNDKRERGLIDITSHKVLPAKDDDKLVSLYAATTGNGKFCFKLVPPAPGSRKGLTFTQPKVHYFAVETKDEMRRWMAALIKATIDIDESVPVLSSNAAPTVSLQKAQLLLSQARENTRKREELNKLKDQELIKPDLSGSSSISPDTDSYDSNIALQSPNTTITTSELTPTINYDSSGFASPYELSATAYSPKSSTKPSSNIGSPVEEFKSHPYSAGAIRHPSSRQSGLNSSGVNHSTAAAAAALSSSYNKNRI